MKLHHLRNATFVIESGENFIIVDPMLEKKATQLPFTLFRFKPKKNPLVDLPQNSDEILQKVTHCIITHLHPDHLDKEAEQYLKSKNIPIICSNNDKKSLQKRGLTILHSLDYWKESVFLNGTIIGIPAVHGYGFIAKPMGNVMGFYIQMTNEKSIYIAADTIFTADVEKVLTQLQPEITVLACGTAQLDLGKPLLMTIQDLIKCIKMTPGKVIANHLEALNHCPTTRNQLQQELQKHQLLNKVWIPNDGESLQY